MAQRLTADQWLAQVRSGSKVLLLNPYVQDVRYPWVRWNQPLDLLKLARWLCGVRGCEVELIDCMLPSDAGRVSDRYLEDLSTGERYRTFGVVIDKSQRDLLHALNREWAPDYVVLSTLTSYWGPRVIPAIRAALRSAMPQVQVVLSGAFAMYEPDRATRTMVDTVVTSLFPTQNCVPHWDLYRSPRTLPFHEGRKCRFAGLTFNSSGDGAFVLEQVRAAKRAQINSFVFFEADLFRDGGEVFRQALSEIRSSGRIDLHGLCGITPSKAPGGMWELMLEAGFRSVHLEYDKCDNSELNLDSYARAAEVLRRRLSQGDMSGFVMVGCPGDDLATLIRHTLEILATMGSVIPKPYTPSPMEDKPYYDDIVRHAKGRMDKLGPRAFPLEGRPEMPLTREDFEDFFGLTTELNKKLQGRPFDLFDESALTGAFRASLAKGVWKLAEY